MRLWRLGGASRYLSDSRQIRPSQGFYGVHRLTTNFVSCGTNPTSLFYMALLHGGPPMSLGWTPPIWGQVGVGLSRWIEPLEIDTNIPPSISSYMLNLNFISWCLCHYRSVHRSCLVLTISTIRLIATMHLSILKQTLLWGPQYPEIIGSTIDSCRSSVL